MSEGDKLPDSNHFSRYCSGATIHTDGSVDPSAFKLRILKGGKKEDKASVNWAEYHTTDMDDAIDDIWKIIKRVKRPSVDDNSVMALLNVGGTISHVAENSPDKRQLEVRHHPNDRNLSHSGIHNLELDDEIVLELIVQTIKKTYPNCP